MPQKVDLVLNLKGIFIYNDKDKIKRILLWVGYAKFVINGKATLF